MRITTVKRLVRQNIFIHRGGFSYDVCAGMLRSNPILAVWEKSQEPTAAEIALLKEILQKHIEKFFPDAKSGRAQGANTITLKKERGRWTFRKLAWTEGPPWHPQPGTLEDIRQKL